MLKNLAFKVMAFKWVIALSVMTFSSLVITDQLAIKHIVMGLFLAYLSVLIVNIVYFNNLLRVLGSTSEGGYAKLVKWNKKTGTTRNRN